MAVVIEALECNINRAGRGWWVVGGRGGLTSVFIQGGWMMDVSSVAATVFRLSIYDCI